MCSVSALRSSVWTLTRRWTCLSSSTSTLSLMKTPRWPGWTPSPCPTRSLRPKTVRNSHYLDTATTDETTSLLRQNLTLSLRVCASRVGFEMRLLHWKTFVMFSVFTFLYDDKFWCFYFIPRLYGVKKSNPCFHISVLHISIPTGSHWGAVNKLRT